MLRTNSKKVINEFINHIYEHAGIDLDTEMFTIKKEEIGNLYGTTYQEGKRAAEGGCFLIYFDDCREFLKEVLEETEEEANKYNNQQVWELYTHLIARTIEKIAK